MTRRPVVGSASWLDILLLALAAIVVLTLTGLGIWQLQRLEWKITLIDAVESRAYGMPVPPPEGSVSAETHAYLRVSVSGAYRHDLSRRVKAITELGPGSWILTPLRTARGHIWINRGFVPSGSEPRDWQHPEGPVNIEGLLRITEPTGTLLEKNDPEAGRWVSRDVAGLSADVGLAEVKPYFIDADHSGPPEALPRGGLTIVSFRNSHLAYALTWFTMAALFLGAMIFVIRQRRTLL